MSQPAPGEKLYDPAYYDAGYYGGGARGGFKDYKYGSLEQMKQLGIKWRFCDEVAHKTALFVGCALGFEVAYWRERCRIAHGVDVSAYAIANQIPEAKGACQLYAGSKLPFANDEFDLVATFDVLPHLPPAMLEALAADMVRVASRGIVWRGIVKDWRNMDQEIDCRDGAWVRYSTLERMDRLFTQSGKLRLHWLKMHEQYEVTAIYVRA
jgi:hypothetical protein